jgi:hypothetical protein
MSQFDAGLALPPAPGLVAACDWADVAGAWAEVAPPWEGLAEPLLEQAAIAMTITSENPRTLRILPPRVARAGRIEADPTLRFEKRPSR